MVDAAKSLESRSSDRPVSSAAAPTKTLRVDVFLVTRDQSLWPDVEGCLDKTLILKQFDSIEDLIAGTTPGCSAIVLFDARNDPAMPQPTKLQLHSPRFGLIALDIVDRADAWGKLVRQKSIVARVMLPFVTAELAGAIDAARDEMNARIVLFGSGGVDRSATPAPNMGSGRGKAATAFLAIGIVTAIAGAGALLMWRSGRIQSSATPPTGTVSSPSAVSPPDDESPSVSDSPPVTEPLPAESPSFSELPPDTEPAATDDRVDALLAAARRSMAEKHFIDPSEGSALTLYREVIGIDPDNGEARQGVSRIAEILLARIQSALNEKQVGPALQALETARNLAPDDPRLAALDARIDRLRAELGPAQISASIAAQNFDRAASLIDDAARDKSLPAEKIAQLRQELHDRQAQFDVTRYLGLAETRLRQGRLLDPRADSADYYLDMARQAGADAGSLRLPYQALTAKLLTAARAASDQHHPTDALRFLRAARADGASSTIIEPLARDLTASRAAADSAAIRAPSPSIAVPVPVTVPAPAPIIAAAAIGQVPPAKPTLAAARVPEVPARSLIATSQLQLTYPPEARAAGTEGWVVLAFTVTDEGQVVDVHVVDSKPAGTFDAAAVTAASRMVYRPYQQDGRPVRVTTQLRVKFALLGK